MVGSSAEYLQNPKILDLRNYNDFQYFTIALHHYGWHPVAYKAETEQKLLLN